MDYNKIYEKSKNVWGNKSNELLQLIINDIPQESDILDLGSAQGKDAIYLASLGYNIVAVDKSEVACSQLETFIEENRISNILTICEDISNFKIEQEKYFVINIQNTLQFLEKELSLKIIKNIKDALVKNGFVVISSFTIDDPSFINKNIGIKSHFKKQELLHLFLDFEVKFYFETKFLDKGHAGSESPHYHGIVKIIAKKVLN